MPAAAIARNSWQGLMRATVRRRGHRYLYLPLIRTWQQADSLCRVYRGHLVTITSRDEEKLVAGLKPVSQSIWVGLRGDSKSEPVWVTGEQRGHLEIPGPLRYEGGHWIYRQVVHEFPPYAEAGFVIEWDF